MRAQTGGKNIIDGLCKTLNSIRAVKLCRNMEKKGCKPDTVTYNMVIDSLCKDGLVDHALVDQALGLIYQFILVDTYCKVRMPNDAEQVVEIKTMIRIGVFPDVVTYNLLVDGFCSIYWIAPNCYTFIFLMNGYCKSQKVDKAIELFQKMPAAGLKPEVHTTTPLYMVYFGIIHDIQIYTILIDGLCKNKKLDEARNIFDEQKGVQPDVVIHNVLIRGLCEEGFYEEANELF
ncbi:pentatricopeptide repeat-containing protein At2g18520, mitochondrial-like [Apium graveolens]|uniref:pentatricopeptide repeat-containing protein At2g18520, mitochondrial-like n=1 Tax=Apium graveolens TaxID=4045 RepID=UPI003D7ADDE4